MTDDIPELEEEFMSESDANCEKTGTELDLSVIEWEWVDTESRYEQNGPPAENKNLSKDLQWKQVVFFLSIALFAIASSLAAAKIVPIFVNNPISVAIPEPIDETELAGWNAYPFMTPSLDFIAQVSESMEIPRHVKDKISSVVPQMIADGFEKFKGSKEFSTVYGYFTDVADVATGIASFTFMKLQDTGSEIKKALLSEELQSVLPKTVALLRECQSQLEKVGTSAVNNIQSTKAYKSIVGKIKKVMFKEDAPKTWFSWFTTSKDPCKKWLGKDWFDQTFYRICSAWKKADLWELLWPRVKKEKVCDGMFCLW